MHRSQRNGSKKRSDSSGKTDSRASYGARLYDSMPYPRRALWPAALCAALKGRTHGCTDQGCKRDESSCQLGAVHTWPLADMPYCAAYVCFDPKRTSRRDLIGARFDVVIDYFVIMRLADGGASPGAAGEITNVSQAFQPSGLCSAANSP
jgi:hypothetical protein